MDVIHCDGEYFRTHVLKCDSIHLGTQPRCIEHDCRRRIGDFLMLLLSVRFAIDLYIQQSCRRGLVKLECDSLILVQVC